MRFERLKKFLLIGKGKILSQKNRDTDPTSTHSSTTEKSIMFQSHFNDIYDKNEVFSFFCELKYHAIWSPDFIDAVLRSF